MQQVALGCTKMFYTLYFCFEAINAYKVNQNDVIQFHSCMCIPHRNLLANVRVIIMYNGLTQLYLLYDKMFAQ